ncbi:MAG: lysylphosphatidylglycerol synthase transmembrane domain-containing protein [Candidatus Binataceae bacterium]
MPATSNSHADISAGARRHYLGFALRAGVGLAIVVALLWWYDARPIFTLLLREQPAYFIATVVLYVLGQTMSAYRWQLVAALVNIRGSFREFLTYYFVGMFANLFIPGLVGGDAMRSIYLGRRYGRIGEAVASVIADRGLGVIALLWFAAIAALFFNTAGLPHLIIAPTILAGAAAFVLYALGPPLARNLHRAPRRLRRAAALVVPYLQRPAATLPAIALSLVLQASLVVGQWLLALGLGLDVSLSVLMLCVPIANAIASVPLTLNGLGLREGAYLVLLGIAGVGREDAIALGLLWFAATMLGGLSGALAFITTDLPKARSQLPSTSSADR